MTYGSGESVGIRFARHEHPAPPRGHIITSLTVQIPQNLAIPSFCTYSEDGELCSDYFLTEFKAAGSR
jgi:hypothetical protein